MTEGTSQGLFIVVAIVIFGILVSLSYTLFGKTLQPQMVSLFTEATEQVSSDLKREAILSDNLIKYEDLISATHYHNQPLVKDNAFEIIMGDNPRYIAIRTNSFVKTTGKKYRTSGYLTINGKPVTKNMWVLGKETTYNINKPESTKFDAETGYFEFTSVWDNNGVGWETYLLHTTIKDNGVINEGDTFVFTDFKVQEVLN